MCEVQLKQKSYGFLKVICILGLKWFLIWVFIFTCYSIVFKGKTVISATPQIRGILVI